MSSNHVSFAVPDLETMTKLLEADDDEGFEAFNDALDIGFALGWQDGTIKSRTYRPRRAAPPAEELRLALGRPPRLLTALCG